MSGTTGLAESGEMYRTIFDAMSEGVVMRMADRSVRMFNKSAERILGRGFAPGEDGAALGFKWHTIREDGSPYPVDEHPVRIALATGRPVRAVVMGVFRPDGSLVWISVNTEPVFHPGENKPYAVVTTFVDITQRKSTESQLRTLLNTIPDLVWLKDPDGVYLACNKEFELLFGASEEQIVGKTDHDFVDAELADFFRQKDKEAMAAGRPTVNEEWVSYASDGRRVLLETIKTPMRDGAGKLIGVLGIAHDITKARQDQEELQKTAQRLRESEQRWQFALQGSDHGVWDWDLANHRAYYSPQLQAMLGIDEAEFHDTADPERWTRWIHPDDLDVANEAIAAHLRGDAEQIQCRHRMLHANGSYIWVQVRGRVTERDAEGHPTRISGTNTDITQAVAAERALRDNQLMYKSLVEAMPMAFFRLDLDGRVQFANQYMLRAFGIENEKDLIGRIIYERVSTEEAEIARRDVAEIIATGAIKTRVREYFINGVGERRFLEITRLPVIDAEGKTVGIQGVFRDITEQMRAAEQQRLAALVFETSQQAIVVTDAAPSILTVNSAYIRITGTSVEEARGKPLGFTRRTTVDADLKQAIWSIVTRTGHWEGEVWSARNNGETFPQFVTVDALRDAEDRITNYVVQSLDISARVRAEEQLRILNESLEQKVSERTRDLQATVKELEAFSYSISHDLRAPLRSIEGFMRIIEQKHAERLDETGKGYLTRVRNSSRRMDELIDDLLRLSQVTRGKFTTMDVDLSEIAHSIFADLHAQEPDRRVDVRVAPGIKLRGDPRLLKIAMANLIGNAWKFTAKQDQALISISEVDTAHGRAVSIHDNGAGFDMRYADKMFHPFQRLHSSLEFSGTGIGLAIVQRIISRHGGRIWAEGVIGFGATIYFII